MVSRNPEESARDAARDAILLKKLKGYLQSDDLYKKFDPDQYLSRWFAETSLVAAKSGKHGGGELVWRFPVQKEYLNVNQQYAGGAQAAVHDTCTGWTLLTVAKPDFWPALGSTRTLNMSYLEAPQAGDILQLHCKIVHLGSRMALVKGVLTREVDGKIISTSEHHLINNSKDWPSYKAGQGSVERIVSKM